MTYSILDNGNLVVSFDRQDDAHAALDRLAAERPIAEDRLLLIAIDDDGHVVDDCVPGERLARAA